MIFGEHSTKPRARAWRTVGVFAVISTMCASPRSVRWVNGLVSLMSSLSALV